jgi:hypothetical protein
MGLVRRAGTGRRTCGALRPDGRTRRSEKSLVPALDASTLRPYNECAPPCKQPRHAVQSSCHYSAALRTALARHRMRAALAAWALAKDKQARRASLPARTWRATLVRWVPALGHTCVSAPYSSRRAVSFSTLSNDPGSAHFTGRQVVRLGMRRWREKAVARSSGQASCVSPLSAPPPAWNVRAADLRAWRRPAAGCSTPRARQVRHSAAGGPALPDMSNAQLAARTARTAGASIESPQDLPSALQIKRRRRDAAQPLPGAPPSRLKPA